MAFAGGSDFRINKNVVKLLEEGVAIKSPNVFQKQGVIQYFEYSFELAWKTLQDFMIQERGYDEVRGPRLVL